MTLSIPDDILRATQMDEQSLLIEIACHLFDKERITLTQASRLARMERGAFEDELHDRKIPIYRLDVADLEQDLRAIERYDAARGA